jgi:uncharacterized 2Fe-2S/4Fe-4S cluster protein (DUF4445 family)
MTNTAENAIVFLPSNTKTPCDPNRSLLDLARDLKLPLDSPCAGRGICGRCLIRIENGSDRPISPEERRHIRPGRLEAGWRLACRQQADPGLRVHIEQESSYNGRAKLGLRDQELTSAVPSGLPHKVLFSPCPATLGEFDVALDQALRQALPPGQCHAQDATVMKEFASLVTNGENPLTLITESGKITGAEPGDTTGKLFGAAVDIGTTTVALYLLDLESGATVATVASANSQAPFGADVMSRICHCHDADSGLEQLGGLIREDLCRLTIEACEQAKVSPEHIYRWTLVGNSTMQHLFFGIDPLPLGRSPFLPAVNGPISFIPGEYGLPCSTFASAKFLPIVAGHVGADTVGMALAAALDQPDKLTLAVDMGTNGEIVLADEHGRMICASTAAGPAFEGVKIVHGMRAEPGAIDKFWIEDDGTVGWHTIGNSATARGICGSGLMDIAAELIRVGVIDTGGWILPAEQLEGKIPDKLLERLGTGPHNQRQFIISGRDETEVALIQGDVRELQLACGAISSGIKILLRKLGLSPGEIGRVMLAGAFGNYMNPASALAVGMIRDVKLEIIEPIGNAAGSGARMALVDSSLFERACRIARRMEFVELGAEPDWNEQFTDSMFLPEPRD